MFRTLTARRAARGMAVGALILSFTVTLGGRTANAAPAANEATDNTNCSVLAHERNEGAHRLHEAWQEFSAEVRGLQRDARALDRDAKKTKSASTMTDEAREALDGAKSELQKIWTDAHSSIQDLVELGQACKEEQESEDEDAHVTLTSVVSDEDGVVTLFVQFNEKVDCTNDADNGKACAELFAYKANDDADAVKGKTFELGENAMSAEVTFVIDADLTDDEDVEVDVTKDELKFTAGSALTAQDGDSFETNEAAESPVDVSVQTSDLVAKYREVVDQAILDMQAVVDEISAAFADMAEAAQTATTADDDAATAGLEQAKQDRAKDKADHAKGGSDKSKGKGKSKRG